MTERGDTTVAARTPAGEPLAPLLPAATGAARYQLGEQLGAGGMAVVWAAHDQALDRPVAFKVLHDRFLGAEHQERLAAEARAMARLSHPNVVTVYDVGERDGRTFVAMERVGGGSLADWVRSPRPWRQVVEVFRAAGAGLAAAHAAGIVHRDVKPSNILLGNDGRARVADFGVAIDGAPLDLGATDLTTTALTAGVNGTPAYMAPERLRGRRADAASDQFSFAVSLFEVLHGRRPFLGGTIDELVAATARAPSPVRPVPRWLQGVVERGMAADPARRFPTITAMLAALDPRRRQRRLAAAVLAGVVVTGAGGAFALTRSGDDDACPAGATRLHGVWDDPARTRVAAAFSRSSRPYAASTGQVVIGHLDRWVDAWTRAHDRTCAPPAAGDERLAPAPTRRACLDQLRQGLQAMTGRLAALDDDALAGTPARLQRWPHPRLCEEPALVAAALAGPASARAALLEARAALVAGDPAAAGALVRRADEGARTGGDGVLAAQARLLAGLTAASAGELAPAADHLQAAAELARTAGARGVLLEVLLEQAELAPRLGRRPEGRRALVEAEAEQPRVASQALEARLLAQQARYLVRAMQPARALATYDRALALALELDGPASLAASELEAARASQLRALGRVDDALVAARRGVALALPLGEGHPEVAARRRELATTLAAAGDEKAAHGELSRALAILADALGPAHEDVASMQNALALSFLRLGDAGAAVEQLRAAVASDARRGVDKGTALRRGNLGIALLEAGQAAEAVPVLERALHELVGLTDDDFVDAVLFRRSLARALVTVGRADDALRELTRARTALALGHFGDPEELARARRDEAAVLRAIGRAREALAADQEAWRIVSDRLPPGHRERGQTRRALAEDRLALGEARQAIALAEAAIAELASAPPVERAAGRWVLARALWASGERERALEVARGARQDAGRPAVVAAIDAWLAARAGER